MQQFMNFDTSLLSYLGSGVTGRSGTSLRLGILAPLDYFLLLIGLTLSFCLSITLFISQVADYKITGNKKLLRLFGSVFRSTLLAVFNSKRVQSTPDDVIPYPRKIFDPSSTNQDNGMLLKIVSNTRDIGGNFDTGGQTNAGNFSQC
jgi:hypothetical protein